MKRLSRSLPKTLILIAIAALMLAVACGPAATPTPTPKPTATPTPTAAPTAIPIPTAAAQPTATPTAAPKAIPTATPTPTKAVLAPSGKLVYATNEVFPAVFDNSKIAQAETWLWALGALETPARWDENDIAQPNLAESWSWDATMTQITFKVRKGVKFHGTWGEVTAEDFNYSLEAQGSPTGPRNYGLLTGILKDHKIIDSYTFQMTLNSPDLTFFPFFITNETYGAYTIWSKKRADTLGPEKMVSEVNVGTGPYRIETYDTGNKIVLAAVENHWRKTPSFKTLEVVQIGTNESRIAALKVGEADVAGVPITLAEDVKNAGLTLRERAWGGNWSLRIGGLYWVTEYKGKTYDRRPGYDTSKAWIGEYGNATSMENARKAREATALAINRDAIAKDLFKGYAKKMFAPEIIGPNRKVWAAREAQWDYKYDPTRAKQLLTEAGYPNGFTLSVWYTTPPAALVQEVTEAMARDWAAVGIKAEINTIATPAWNADKLQPRNWNGYWVSGGPGGAVRQAEAVRLCRLPSASYNQGNELPDALKLCDQERAELDPAKQMKILEQNLDYFVQWKLIIPLFEQSILIGTSKKVGKWPISTTVEVEFSDPEYAERAQ